MKFLDKMILCIFSVLILLMAVISSACIFGWVDATGLYVFVTKALADQTTCNILLGLNVVLILFAIKGIFLESSTDEGVKDQQSKITLDENNDLSILLTIAVSDQAVIKDLSNNIQVRVKDAIKKSLDVEVKSLDIKVKDMVTPVKDTKEA